MSGGGITGLATAYEVQKAGRSVVVLEASDYVGGRIMTRERNGDIVEVGQQYFLSTYSQASKLLDEIGMTSELIEEGPEIVQYIDKKGKSRVISSETDLVRALGVRGSADLARATLQYSTMGKAFPTYGLDRCIEEYDDITAAEGFAWAGEKFMDFIVRPMCYGNAGTALEHTSLFDAIRLFRSNLKQPKHYGFRGGNRALPRKLAELVPVMLNAEVSELLTTGDAVTVHKLADGRTIGAGQRDPVHHAECCRAPYTCDVRAGEGFSIGLRPHAPRARLFLSRSSVCPSSEHLAQTRGVD